jgi:hypothetical protein
LRVPQLFTCRYFAEDALSTAEVVPVRISYEAPIIPLGYPLEETAESLVPEFAMLGEWDHLCQTYRHKLDALGVERIGEELFAISARYDGRPLALLDYEDLTRGLRNHRVVFSHWWEQRTGQAVFELTNDGEKLHYSRLPKQVQPKLPKQKEDDPRYRSSPPLTWPLAHGEVEEWLEGRYWQQARSRSNPHSYTLRRWGHEETFELIVLHVREHGYEALFAGSVYTQYDCGDHFYWTMGASLPTTVVLNRKPLPDSKAEEDKGSQAAELELFVGEDRT